MKKFLAIGIMLLFIGMSIPSTGTNVEKGCIMPTPNGNTLYVGGDGPNNYTKIQDAIDDAKDGDTVFVYNKIYKMYFEQLFIYKSISLIGEKNGNKYPIVHGECKRTIINIEADYVLIHHLHLKYCGYDDYCIEAENCNNLVIIDNKFTLESKDHGSVRGCVCIKRCTNTSIHNNSMKKKEYGLWSRDYGVNILKDSVNNNVSNNSIKRLNYGISSEGDNTIIYGNYINDNWIGLLIECNGTRIINNTISGNHEEGIVLRSNNNVVVNNLINDNGFQAVIPCGGIEISSASAYNFISRNRIIHNKPYGIDDWCWMEWGYNNISNNYISNNTAVGIFCESKGKNEISYNHVSNQPYGVVFDYSDYNHLSNNDILNNSEAGVMFHFAYNNHVCENNILNNDKKGVYVYYSNRNIVTRNNLIDNGLNAFFELLFLRGFSNKWIRNYWNVPRTSPKLIFGFLGYRLMIPWFNFDWQPAQEPYDI